MDENEYRQRMQRKKAAMDRKIAAAPNDKGILLALLGGGPGKSSSAYGMAARAVGHGMRVAIARFMPGDSGESRFFEAFEAVDMMQVDDGLAKEPAAITRDRIAAWLSDTGIGLVVIDDAARGIEQGVLDAGILGSALDRRPVLQHAVITGATLPEQLVDRADTVTQMRDARTVLDTVATGTAAEPETPEQTALEEAAADEAADTDGRRWQDIDRLDDPRGQGRLLVHTGNGKGKSSAAFGKLARVLGHGRRAGVVQFIKGQFETGERALFDGHPAVTYRVMGQGFSWEVQDRNQDRASAEAAWAEARTKLADDGLSLVVLDELNNTIKKGYVDVDEVIAALRGRPPHQDVIVTGRNARPALMREANAVTQVHKLRHALEAGYRAQRGVDL